MTTIKGLSPREREQILKELQKVRTGIIAEFDPNAPAAPYKAALIPAVCPCGTNILIQPGRVLEKTRAVCPDCAEDIIREAKEAGREIKVVKAADPPAILRTNDGSEHPIEVRPRMKINLSTITDAELGAIVRQRMLDQKLAYIETEAPKAEAKKEKKEKKADKEHKTGRKAVQQEALPEIIVSDRLTIPTLDLNEVTSLDELVPAAVRSPYNKALHQLKGDPLPPETSYATLLGTHRAIAAAVAEYKPKAKKGETEAVPEVDPEDEKTMITAIMATFECSKKEAKQHLKKFLQEAS